MAAFEDFRRSVAASRDLLFSQVLESVDSFFRSFFSPSNFRRPRPPRCLAVICHFWTGKNGWSAFLISPFAPISAATHDSLHSPKAYRTREEFAEAYSTTSIPSFRSSIRRQPVTNHLSARLSCLKRAGSTASASFTSSVSWKRRSEAPCRSRTSHEKLSHGRRDRRPLLASQKP